MLALLIITILQRNMSNKYLDIEHVVGDDNPCISPPSMSDILNHHDYKYFTNLHSSYSLTLVKGARQFEITTLHTRC
jgi:hypothetical protein